MKELVGSAYFFVGYSEELREYHLVIDLNEGELWIDLGTVV